MANKSRASRRRRTSRPSRQPPSRVHRVPYSTNIIQPQPPPQTIHAAATTEPLPVIVLGRNFAV
eukprot:scaffold21837_cov60-Attheya_sp.AAC.2